MQAKAVLAGSQVAEVKKRRSHRARHTAVGWAKIIAAHRRSALTVVEFCRRRGIAETTFWYWRKRLVRMAQPVTVAQPAQRFLAVPLVTPVAEQIEVDLGTMRVRLGGTEAARVVDAIIARLGGGAER